MKNCTIVLVVLSIIVSGCQEITDKEMGTSFSDDIAFLKKYTDALVLKTPEGDGQIIVIPQYQGRVMTSTLNGGEGNSFGWINYDLIKAETTDERFNAYGGEDRFWLGPEGGQFSLYHQPGGPFTLDNWYVPPQIDREPFQLISSTDQEARMTAEFTISNYSGTEFKVKVDRRVRIYEKSEIMEHLGLSASAQLSMVGFESENHLKNTGSEVWNKEDGLLSIWILGMYNPGDNVVIVLPYYQGGVGSLGEVVNDQYFGEVPSSRLRSSRGVVFFKGDGNYRSKIGMNWMRAKNLLGSYDPDEQLLTVVTYNKPEERSDYVKAMWEVMKDPYDGDVINSYNDGKPGPDQPPLGPFYELETSSPVRELQPEEELVHIHRTFHLKGSENELNRITEQLFNVKLQNIKEAFIH